MNFSLIHMAKMNELMDQLQNISLSFRSTIWFDEMFQTFPIRIIGPNNNN